MKPQNQFPLSPMSLLPQINTNLLKIITCFVVFGLGIAFGTIYSSNVKSVPFFSSQTIRASPPLIQSSNPTLPLQDVKKSQDTKEEPIDKPEISLIAEEQSQNVQNEMEKLPKIENVHEEVVKPQQETVAEPQQETVAEKETGEGNAMTMMHGMSDEELIAKALEVNSRSEGESVTTPKIAFMFLARGELPFMPLWENLFRGHDGKFSIYLHLSPDYNGNEPTDSVFYGRRIPSKVVGWGKVNMMEAERRLLANALLDPSNQRFVLLSESCVPLFNFPTIYSYLINSTLSFIELYDDPGPTGRGRYKKPMNPPIDITQWRKGSQWFEVDRFLAVEIISDTIYFPVFKRYCKGSCYTDEHYLPTLVNIKYGERNANRSLTWVDWSVKGAHPARYYRNKVTPEFLKELREGSRCLYNGVETTTCYLFGRKFLPNSLIRFLHFSPSVMGFG